MTTFRHPLIASLALTLLLTVGAESSHAQKGRFRGLSNRSSFNGGGFNGGGKTGGSSFKFGKSSGLKLSGGNSNNSNQSFSGNFMTRQKSLGNFNNSSHKTSSPPLGVSGGNIKKIGRGKIGGVQSIPGTGKPGSQILGGTAKIKNRFGNKFNGQKANTQKFNGLKNVLQGKNDKTAGLHNFGHGKGGHGHGSKLLHLIQHNQKHGKICLDHKAWCHSKPQKCHWWYNYCKPLAYCEPEHHVHCQWNYVTCDYLVGGHVVHADARWYLGMKGLLLPGQGVGVEEVAPGSPADSVGLAPGMVITRCNGIDLVDEAALGQAIAASGGVLQMDLLLAEGTPATCVVVMQRVTSVNF